MEAPSTIEGPKAQDSLLTPEKENLFNSLLGRAENNYTDFSNYSDWDSFLETWYKAKPLYKESLLADRELWVELKKGGHEFSDFLINKIREKLVAKESFLVFKHLILYISLCGTENVALFSEALSHSLIWKDKDGSTAHMLCEAINKSENPAAAEAVLLYIDHILSPEYTRKVHKANDLHAAVAALVGILGMDAAKDALKEMASKSEFLTSWLNITKFYYHKTEKVAVGIFHSEIEDLRLAYLKEHVNDPSTEVETKDNDYSQNEDDDDEYSQHSYVPKDDDYDAYVEPHHPISSSLIEKKAHSAEISPEELPDEKSGLPPSPQNLKKVSEKLGTNEGGWYQDEETGKRYYVKFYNNPNQGKIEFIANSVYSKLGIRAARSHLLDFGDRLAVASEEIIGAASTTREEQYASDEVRRGFIADAYLANWDVIGLVFDNIVRDKENHMHRIDNGGALNFRAQGVNKDFDPDDIPELKNMLRPDYSAGQVFKGLTREEMKRQAQDLVDHLLDVDIEMIVDQARLDEELSETLKRALKGRLVVLREHFNLERKQSRFERLPVAIEKLKQEAERVKDTQLRPKVAFLGDSNKIENQQIDITDSEDMGLFQVSFKLTQHHYSKVLAKIKKMGQVDSGSIQYHKNGSPGDKFTAVNAYMIRSDSITIKISKGIKEEETSYSTLGLVQIDIPKNIIADAEELNQKVGSILNTIFDVPNALEVPDLDAEEKYKLARYQWHHKLDSIDPIDATAARARLQRKEISPGYFTFVDPGKHKEYAAISEYAAYHYSNSIDILPKVIKAGGFFLPMNDIGAACYIPGHLQLKICTPVVQIMYLPELLLEMV